MCVSANVDGLGEPRPAGREKTMPPTGRKLQSQHDPFEFDGKSAPLNSESDALVLSTVKLANPSFPSTRPSIASSHKLRNGKFPPLPRTVNDLSALQPAPKSGRKAGSTKTGTEVMLGQSTRRRRVMLMK